MRVVPIGEDLAVLTRDSHSLVAASTRWK